MEVACYNPVLDVESPRIYLDWQRYSDEVVNQERVQEKMQVAREQWLRHVKVGEFNVGQTSDATAAGADGILQKLVIEKTPAGIVPIVVEHHSLTT